MLRLCVVVMSCGLMVLVLCMVLSRIGNSVLMNVMNIMFSLDDGNIRIVSGIYVMVGIGCSILSGGSSVFLSV